MQRDQLGDESVHALVVEDAAYHIASRTGKPGSVAKDGTFTANFSAGRPGAWSVAIDGATGAHWMNVVKDHLEQPYRMLLG